MPLHLGWDEIALRLALATIAGAFVGLDRGEHGRPAGLRTTLLVCLAAAVSMIQTNLLLATDGKRDSFVTLDLMRLPLGILTGMGFIGGGAISRRATPSSVSPRRPRSGSSRSSASASAAARSPWVASFAIGMIVLRGLKRLEARLPQDRRATLTLTVSLDGPTEEQICDALLGRGYGIASVGSHHDKDQGRWTLSCEVRWRSKPTDLLLPPIVKELSGGHWGSRLDWSPEGRASDIPASTERPQ